MVRTTEGRRHCVRQAPHQANSAGCDGPVPGGEGKGCGKADAWQIAVAETAPDQPAGARARSDKITRLGERCGLSST